MAPQLARWTEVEYGSLPSAGSSARFRLLFRSCGWAAADPAEPAASSKHLNVSCYKQDSKAFSPASILSATFISIANPRISPTVLCRWHCDRRGVRYC